MSSWKLLMVGLAVSLVIGCTPGTRWKVVRKPPQDPYAEVRAGMSERDVIGLLGKPSKRAAVEMEGNVPGYYLRWVGNQRLITVYFVGGTVASKERF